MGVRLSVLALLAFLLISCASEDSDSNNSILSDVVIVQPELSSQAIPTPKKKPIDNQYNFKVEASEAIDAAYNFLYRQMDQFNTSVMVSGNSAYQAYYPSGFMGDVNDLTVQTVQCDPPRRGQGCIKIDYHPKDQSDFHKHWAGLYFQYPDKNWGEYPGRNLSGATNLTFWAKSNPPMSVKFIAGGINRPKSEQLLYQDSFGPQYAGEIYRMFLPIYLERDRGFVPLNQNWQFFEISLAGTDLSSVIGPLGIVVSQSDRGRSGSILLDDVEINLSTVNEPHFIQSFVPGDCVTGAPDNVSHIYDQSLALLAFLARGTPEDIKRAKLIAQTFVQAQNHDRRFSDGRLRNAYASGTLIDSATGNARIPGQWDSSQQNGRGKYLEDEFSVGSDTGNMAWAGLSLVQMYKFDPSGENASYLEAAIKIGEWIVKENTITGEFGGFRGGYENFELNELNLKPQIRSEWRSTEHNIDLVAFFGNLASAVGLETTEGQKWLRQKAHARHFVESMRVASDGKASFLRTGTKPGSDIPNEEAIPLDTQTWSVLGMGQPEQYEAAVEWALQNCGAGEMFPHAFDFNCKDGDGAWWEGTAQMVTALKLLGKKEEAELILADMEKHQLLDGNAAGAMPAASRCMLTTGFNHFWHSDNKLKPWTYPNTPHVGATAWYLFAQLGKNPYYLFSDR